MKKIIACFLITFLIFSVANAEIVILENEGPPEILNSYYDGERIYGVAQVPNNGTKYWIRASIFFDNALRLVIVFCPIEEDGRFELYLKVGTYTSSTIQIVDTPVAAIPGTYTVYDTAIVRPKRKMPST